MRVTEALRARIELLPQRTTLRAGDIRREFGFQREDALDQAFSRLVKRGDLMRLAKGVYWKGARGRFGMIKPATLEAALAVASDRCPGPAGPSAAAYFGLTTQIPPRQELAVLGREMTRMANVVFRMRSNIKRVGLSPAEIAVLEIARDDCRFCEVSRGSVLAKIRTLAASDVIDLARIRCAGEAEGPAVRAFVRALG